MRIFLLPFVFFAVVACAAPKVHQSPGASVLDPASREILTGQVPVTDTSMDQIGPDNTRNIQDQIATLPADQSITAEQLRAYADRCAPDATAPAPEGTNCDELRLMIKKRFKSADDLNRALNVLDNLGRGGEADALLDPISITDQLPPDVLQTPVPPPATKSFPEGTIENGVPHGVLIEKSGG